MTAATGGPAEPQTPAAAEPATATNPTATAPPAKKSLEESLADLDESTRTFVLGEVSTARSEAKGLRERLKAADEWKRAAEPKVGEYDRLAEASKTAEERAQEAMRAAEARATAATLRVARAEVKAALAGVVDNADTIIEDLNLARFIDNDGEINTEAVDALRQKYAAFSAPRRPAPDTSQASGANGRTPTSPADEFGAFIKQQMRPTG